MLPNFLFIGSSKSGSSWLFEVFLEHPDIYVPIAKDVMYFDRYYSKGLEWYQSYFKDVTTEKAVGEMSHDYFLNEEYAKRIHETLGKNIKLLCTLREPIDKLKSFFKYERTTWVAKDTSFSDYLFKYNRIDEIKYYENLRPFYEIFGHENIHISFYEDLKKDPRGFIKDIFDFLDVDSNFVPAIVDKKVLQSRKSRNENISRFVYFVAQKIRELGFANFVGAVKRNQFFEKLLYKKSKDELVVSIQDLENIKSLVDSENKKLQLLIGKELPKEWNV